MSHNNFDLKNNQIITGLVKNIRSKVLGNSYDKISTKEVLDALRKEFKELRKRKTNKAFTDIFSVLNLVPKKYIVFDKVDAPLWDLMLLTDIQDIPKKITTLSKSNLNRIISYLGRGNFVNIFSYSEQKQLLNKSLDKSNNLYSVLDIVKGMPSNDSFLKEVHDIVFNNLDKETDAGQYVSKHIRPIATKMACEINFIKDLNNLMDKPYEAALEKSEGGDVTFGSFLDKASADHVETFLSMYDTQMDFHKIVELVNLLGINKKVERFFEDYEEYKFTFETWDCPCYFQGLFGQKINVTKLEGVGCKYFDKGDLPDILFNLFCFPNDTDRFKEIVKKEFEAETGISFEMLLDTYTIIEVGENQYSLFN